ncbi:hypothetical protein FXO37_10940 [Capsicum annuum]|nr:hypothetical protein FXO37_10940 [Capsicum annuum]
MVPTDYSSVATGKAALGNILIFQRTMVYDLLKRRLGHLKAFLLRQQVNYQEEVSCPRILRWLSPKINKNVKFLDLFNPPKEAGARATGEQHELKKVDVTVEATVEEHNITVDSPSTASKYEEKVVPVSLGERKNYPFGGDCGHFVAIYAEYLSNGLQVLNDGLDARLLHKRYAALLWKYREAEAQKPFAINVKDQR